jgi:hypothetical protein
MDQDHEGHPGDQAEKNKSQKDLDHACLRTLAVLTRSLVLRPTAGANGDTLHVVRTRLFQRYLSQLTKIIESPIVLDVRLVLHPRFGNRSLQVGYSGTSSNHHSRIAHQCLDDRATGELGHQDYISAVERKHGRWPATMPSTRLPRRPCASIRFRTSDRRGVAKWFTFWRCRQRDRPVATSYTLRRCTGQRQHGLRGRHLRGWASVTSRRDAQSLVRQLRGSRYSSRSDESDDRKGSGADK